MCQSILFGGYISSRNGRNKMDYKGGIVNNNGNKGGKENKT